MKETRAMARQKLLEDRKSKSNDGFTVDRAFEVAKEIMNDESLAGCSSVRVTLTINDEYEGYVVELFNDFNESGVPDTTIFDEVSLRDFYADMVEEVRHGR